MIEIKQIEDRWGLQCSCGAHEEKDFSRYLHRFNFTDAKGRIKPAGRWEIMCGKCKESVEYAQIEEQFKKETTIKK